MPEYGDYDESYTPDRLWDDLRPLMPDDRLLVDPFNGDRFVRWAKGQGLDAQAGHDFWGEDLPDGCMVVSNPPFTLKEEVMMELYERGVPFLLIQSTSILNTSVMDHLDPFHLVVWGNKPAFESMSGKRVRAPAVAVGWGIPAGPGLTYLSGGRPMRTTFTCECGCRVKGTNRTHERTRWHRERALPPILPGVVERREDTVEDS